MNLRDALQGIYDTHGKLTPALVVDEARPEDHPLHDRFEWDDSIAGENWRRHQAHDLIRSVKVVRKKSGKQGDHLSVRAFHAVRKEDGYNYEPVEQVIADPFTTKLLLKDMEREWRQLKKRYDQFSEFWEMVRGDLGGDIAAD